MALETGTVRRMLTVVSTCVSLAGLGGFSYSMAEQTHIQADMDQTMAGLNRDVAQTTPLVAQTAAALRPLQSATTSLVQIEQAETETVSHLRSMNDHLAQIGLREENILSDMQALQQGTVGLAGDLRTASGLEQGILQGSETAAALAGQAAAALGQLQHSTTDISEQLSAVNSRLSALRLLP
ncbi:MAG: hypothetical protein K6T78_09240 [Alicyclobacillus sp.]|nr:hypothetical protein [Alicyclobacillus sp.]